MSWPIACIAGRFWLFINFVLCLSEFPGQTTANPNIMTGESFLDQIVQKEWTKMGYWVEYVTAEWAFSVSLSLSLSCVLWHCLEFALAFFSVPVSAHSHYPQLSCLLWHCLKVKLSFALWHCPKLSFALCHCPKLTFALWHCSKLSFALWHCHKLSFSLSWPFRAGI